MTVQFLSAHFVRRLLISGATNNLYLWHHPCLPLELLFKLN